MAIFDEQEQKIVVRVVYDGPALAGKTTNLEQLCHFFTPLRRSELYSPKALAGRTLFFDWLQLEGGVVAGYGLRCHLVTVPGQAVLSRRRWHLLDIADVVVFVTSSSLSELKEALPMYKLLKQYLERTNRGDIPILIQANKQDLQGAAAPHAVAEALGAPSATAIAANAASGGGVRETVVLAIRAAAERVQRQVLDQGLHALSGQVLGGEALMHEMAAREEQDPQSPLDVVLRHHTSISTEEPKAGSARIHNSAPPASRDDGDDDAPEPETVRGAQALLDSRQEEAPSDASAMKFGGEGVTPDTKPPSTVPEAPSSKYPPANQPAESIAPSSSEIDSSWSVPCGPPDSSTRVGSALSDRLLPETLPAPPSNSPTTATLTRVERLADPPRLDVQADNDRPTRPPPSSSRVFEPLPPLPRADVPSGLVWPSANGREILQRIPIDDAILHTELTGRSGTADGSGRSDAYIYEAGIWCLKTALRRRYLDADEARDALLQLVRHKILLGDLLVQNTVLTVQNGPTGDFWLWTITPWLTTLRGSMTHAVHRRDSTELERSLVIFGELAVRSLLLAARSEVLLDVHPSNFASLRDRCYYLDDDVARGSRLPAVGFALLRRVEEYADWPAATEAYIDVVAAGMAEHLKQSDIERLDLRRALQDAIVRSPGALAAKERFLAALASCSAG
ncbi:MAG: ADP-ribosylation factor-like protein [Polyangiaceae bacterium]